MLESRGIPVGLLDAKQEKLTSIGNGSHVIEGTKATVGNKEALTRNRIAPDHGDKSVLLVHLATGLNNSIGVNGFQEVVHYREMELMITVFPGIIADVGGIIIRRGCDIQIRAITGEEMISLQALFEAKRIIKPGEQRRKSRVVELGALVNERGTRGYGVPGIGGIAGIRVNDGPIILNFAGQRTGSHEHGHQQCILERKQPVTLKIMARIHDILVLISLHIRDDF